MISWFIAKLSERISILMSLPRLRTWRPARKASGSQGSVVAYVITAGGPEPVEDRKSAIDYEHYVQKQVRAVAEPVLAVLGLNFDRIIGDDTQLKLF